MSLDGIESSSRTRHERLQISLRNVSWLLKPSHVRLGFSLDSHALSPLGNTHILLSTSYDFI
jgi:hypothetical protein